MRKSPINITEQEHIARRIRAESMLKKESGGDIMRIDAFNRVSQLYQNNSTRNIAKAGKTTQPDRVEISQMGKDYQVAKAAVAATPDVRTDLVNDIKSRMANGTYDVSMEMLADKLLAREI